MQCIKTHDILELIVLLVRSAITWLFLLSPFKIYFACLLKAIVSHIYNWIHFLHGSDIESGILQNSFCFEKRDWMTVRPKELPHGSKLVWIFSLHLKLLRIPILIICNVAQNYDSNRPWLPSPNRQHYYIIQVHLLITIE